MATYSIPNLDDLKIELLPDVIDRRGREEPESIFCAIPRGNEVSDGFRDVTFREFTNAINRASWFLEKTLGRSDSFETLCYLGPSDLRYSILAIAAVKTGHKAFWSSPRNSHEGHVSLLKATKCKYFLTPVVIPPGVEPIIEELKIRHIVIPEQDIWMNPELVPDYPLGRRYEDVVYDPFLVIHTSGTSGYPKPIALTYGTISLIDLLNQVPFDDRGNKTIIRFLQEQPGRLFCPFPMFHGAGIYLFLICSLYFRNIPVLAPNKPLTPELADEVHRSGVVTASFLPPSIVDGISKVPEFLETLERLRFIIISSAPLPEPVADIVKLKTRLVNIYGQTETGMLHSLIPDAEDPTYVRIGPLSGVEFRHYEDDLYECVVVRNEKYLKAQGAFLWQPEATELRTNDLFRRHPDLKKSDYWLYQGRLDDIIVFENGEKINPVSMENLIGTHPKVRSAMVVGAGRIQSSVLVELSGSPPETNEEKENLIQEIWPTIEQANEEIPAHGKVVRELILFTKPEFPILHSPKGTLRRGATYRPYADMFDEAYKAADDDETGEAFSIDLGASEEILQVQLRQLISHTTGIDPSDVDDDFFARGMDSLQVLQIARRLRASLRNDITTVKRILPSLIYAHPSISKLSAAISSSARAAQNGAASEPRIREITSMLEKHMTYLPPRSDEAEINNKCFVLTGSTGGLGSYLLACLMEDQSTRRIYCLNRSEDAAIRQTKINVSRGLPSDFDPNRVTFLHCDFRKADLGLSHEVFCELIRNTTHIIHNAWTVDWKLSLSSFEKVNLASVHSLINLASLTTRRAHLTFISSLGTVNQWLATGQQSPAPEELAHDPRAAESMGYAESKYIAEHLLGAAWVISGVQTSVLRIGQIAGPVQSEKGQWTANEWMPRLIRSCKHLGLVPKSLGFFDKVDWLPVDILAKSILELIGTPFVGEKMPVYNVVNPSQTTWHELYPTVQRCLIESGAHVDAVEFDEWVRALRKTVAATKTAEDVAKNPAVQLIDFFEGMNQATENDKPTEFSTLESQKASKSLRQCGPMKAEWMELFMRQWGYLSVKVVNGDSKQD